MRFIGVWNIFLFKLNFCVFTEENDVKISKKCYSWTSKAVFSKHAQNLSLPGSRILPKSRFYGSASRYGADFLYLIFLRSYGHLYFWCTVFLYFYQMSGVQMAITSQKNNISKIRPIVWCRTIKSSYWPNLRSIEAIFQEEIDFECVLRKQPLKFKNSIFR